MKSATFIGATVFYLVATAGAAQGQSPWNLVATRADAERDAQIQLAANTLFQHRDCKTALRQVREVASWYEIDADPRVRLITARASACLGDSVTAAQNFGIYQELGGRDPDMIREFGAVCQAVLRPLAVPADSIDTARTLRELRADSLRLERAVSQVRPRMSRDSVRVVPNPEPQRELRVKPWGSRDEDVAIPLWENPRVNFTRYSRTVGRPEGNRRETMRLIGEQERVDAKLACVAWRLGR